MTDVFFILIFSSLDIFLRFSKRALSHFLDPFRMDHKSARKSNFQIKIKSMKTTMNKLAVLLLCALISVSLLSCNNEDQNPCVDQSLTDFMVMLVDEEDNNVLEEEGFNEESLSIYYLDENEEEVAVDFEIKETSEESKYIVSSEMSEISLEGVTEFLIKISEETIVELTYKVEMSNATGCKVYAYEALDQDGEELAKTTSGSPRPYLLTIPDETE